MDSKSKMVKAALSGLMIGSVCLSGCTTWSGGGSSSEASGECHGVNSCKGTGDCGGKGHSCAGKNECKGKGWKKMSEKDCNGKGGTFKKGM
jgi:hypothetical protein